MEVTCEDVRQAAEDLGAHVMAQREETLARDWVRDPSPPLGIHWDMGRVNVDLAQLFEKSRAMVKLGQYAPAILAHLLTRDEYFFRVSFTFEEYGHPRPPPRGGHAV